MREERELSNVNDAKDKTDKTLLVEDVLREAVSHNKYQMSTHKSIAQVTRDIQYWLRLATFLHGPLKESLFCVLHNKKYDPSYKGLPGDPSDLYKELSTDHKETINKLIKNKVLKKDQVEILLPKNGENKTYSDVFDVTLLVVLIINCTTLRPPKDGWNKSPSDDDTGVAANVLRGREWRNFLNHTDANAIDEAAFNLKWTEGVELLKGLGGQSDQMKTLKTISLDPKHEIVLKSLYHFNNVVRTKQQTQDSDIGDLQARVDVLEKKQNTTDQLDDKIEKCEVDNDMMSKQLHAISIEIEMLKQLQQDSNELNRNSEREGKNSWFFRVD